MITMCDGFLARGVVSFLALALSCGGGALDILPRINPHERALMARLHGTPAI